MSLKTRFQTFLEQIPPEDWTAILEGGLTACIGCGCVCFAESVDSGWDVNCLKCIEKRPKT